MLQNRRMPGGKVNTGGLVLAGLAAYAYYKYSKMSAEQKRNLTTDLKDKGKKLFDQYMPQEVKDMFGKKDDTMNTGSGTATGSAYQG